MVRVQHAIDLFPKRTRPISKRSFSRTGPRWHFGRGETLAKTRRAFGPGAARDSYRRDSSSSLFESHSNSSTKQSSNGQLSVSICASRTVCATRTPRCTTIPNSSLVATTCSTLLALNTHLFGLSNFSKCPARRLRYRLAVSLGRFYLIPATRWTTSETPRGNST